MASRPGAQGRSRPEHRKRRGRISPQDRRAVTFSDDLAAGPGIELAADREDMSAYLDFWWPLSVGVGRRLLAVAPARARRWLVGNSGK